MVPATQFEGSQGTGYPGCGPDCLAAVQDRDGARPLLFNLKRARRRIRHAWADAGYAGQLLPWAPKWLKMDVEVVKRPTGSHTFEVLPRRWVVERTLAWITSYRRCARDYERLPEHHEAFVEWAAILQMTRRLAASPAG